MVRKLLIIFIFTLMNFTNIYGQVPDDYQEIVFDDLTYVNNDTKASQQDNIYQSLWSFVNFRQSYIEVNGTTIVSNGESITDATFGLRLTGGQHFELEYDDLIYRFTLEEVEMNDIEVTVFPYVLVIIPTGNRTEVPENINLTLSLPNVGFIYEPDVSESFIAILTGYGLNNPVGLLILFFVIILAFNIGLEALRVPSIVYIIGNLVITSGFMVFNLIPIWAGFIFISIIILFLIMSFKGAKV